MTKEHLNEIMSALCEKLKIRKSDLVAVHEAKKGITSMRSATGSTNRTTHMISSSSTGLASMDS